MLEEHARCHDIDLSTVVVPLVGIRDPSRFPETFFFFFGDSPHHRGLFLLMSYTRKEMQDSDGEDRDGYSRWLVDIVPVFKPDNLPGLVELLGDKSPWLNGWTQRDHLLSTMRCGTRVFRIEGQVHGEICSKCGPQY